MREENGIAIWIKWFDFSFGEEEYTRLRLEGSTQMLQNETEKNLECVTLAAAVELMCVKEA